MLTEYIQAAMRHAHYELMENNRFFGSISECRGAWGEGNTLEECRRNSEERWNVGSWSFAPRRPLAVIDGIDLNAKAYAEADQMA